MPYSVDEHGIVDFTKYTLPKTGNNIVFSLRIDEGVYEEIKKIAKQEGRAINAQLLRYIEGGVATYMVNNPIL